MSIILTLAETEALVRAGKKLFIAGEADLLRRLPKGQWIGGTASHFVGQDGGVCGAGKLCVQEIWKQDYNISIRVYGVDDLPKIPNDAFGNGYSIIFLPFHSPVHLKYATDVPEYENIFLHPIVGFVASVDPFGPKDVIPMVINGMTGEMTSECAMVMHVELPPTEIAKVGIINVYEIDPNGPTIVFEKTGVTANEAIINGVRQPLAPFLKAEAPGEILIADYMGTNINVDIQHVPDDESEVSFYGPVFRGIHYRFIRHDVDYSQKIRNQAQQWNGKNVVYAFNCISNYLNFKLEGEKLGPFTGPCTFGEVAYQILNGTLAYMLIEPVTHHE